MRRAVFACLLLIAGVLGAVSPAAEVAEASDLRPSAAPQVSAAAAQQAAQQAAQEAALREQERRAEMRRVADAVLAGEKARADVIAARRDRQERAAREAVRSALPGCDGLAPSTIHANGNWPAAALCELPGGGHFLRPDAAEAFVRLSFDYAQAFGTPLCLTDSYRSLAGQRRLARAKPRLAARAGTSTHGDGVAVDLCGGAETFGAAEHIWLRENGLRFGWDNPDWARVDGSRPEPWHWEFTGAPAP